MILMGTLAECYEQLKPEDKAFVDGFLSAVKQLEERGDLVSYDFMPALPDESTLAKCIDEAVKVVTTAQVEQLNAYLRDLIAGTLDSYEDDVE